MLRVAVVARRAVARGLVGLALAVASGGGLFACAPDGAEETPRPPVGNQSGLSAPPLQGRSVTGEPYRLEARPGEPVVLVFYRGEHCGLCRVRLEQLRAHLPAYRRMGARVLAATADPPEVGAQTSLRLGAEIPIVSVDSAVLEAWGVLDPDTRVPVPATFLLDERGVIRFRHVGRNAADRASDASLLTVLERREQAR